MGKTNIKGLHLIDSIATTQGILEYMERYKLLQNNNILFSDHREYLIYIHLEAYLGE